MGNSSSSTLNTSGTARAQRSAGARALVAILAVLGVVAVLPAALVVSTATPAGAAAPTLVRIAGNEAGWVLTAANGTTTKQWISPSCRSDVQAAGHVFTLTTFSTFAGYSPTTPTQDCAEIVASLGDTGTGPRWVTNSANNNAGWLLINNTKQWIDPSCRSAIQATGTGFAITPWSEFSTLTNANPLLSCDDLIAVSTGQGTPGAQWVTNSANNNAGWLLINNTKQWIDPSCRAAIQGTGTAFVVTPWSEFSTLTNANPLLSCDELTAVATGNGGGGNNNSNVEPTLAVTTMVDGLTNIWDMGFTPDGTMIFTERGGALHVLLPNGTTRPLIADMDDLGLRMTAGLLGLAIDPNFANNRRIYTCQSTTDFDGQVVAWTINPAYTKATRVTDPVVDGFSMTSAIHTGCRVRIGPDGFLWITTGDNNTSGNPQNLDSLNGKILRVNRFTGEGAPTNPYAASADADRRRVYTFGHRNPQGIAFRPSDGSAWISEHGPAYDDEINLLTSGGNYGWAPGGGYDQEVPMTDRTRFPGAVQARWTSGEERIAPSGIAWIEGSEWGRWNGSLAVATLRGEALRIYTFNASGGFVRLDIPVATDGTAGRIRAVEMGPDGSLYISTTNGSADQVLRVTPSLVQD